MKVLITGSRGYVGNRLCQILRKDYKNKIDIIGLDTNFYQFKKKLEKKIITKDIRDIKISDLENIDSVIHLASLSNDPLGSLNESLTKDINHLEAGLSQNVQSGNECKKIYICFYTKCLRNLKI